MSDAGRNKDTDIAIVGMSGRFPGARNVEEFWNNLVKGVESRTLFSDEEMLAEGARATDVNHPTHVKAGFILDDIDLFDGEFFGFYPFEVELMDPQHRLFLECAWEALEHAGYDPDAYKGLIGVYGGAAFSTYLIFNLLANADVWRTADAFQALIGNDKDHLAARVSYKLNLRGPSIAIQTACSTSLVAVHGACRDLLTHECDMALAGGVAIEVPQKIGYRFREGHIASPDGHCRAFDARGRGTVMGSGVGIVVLKRLADALTDRDHIHAVICGSAVNNDGAGKIGYTAPSVEGQAQAISAALLMAGVDPATIGYVEAHGTATELGDPIEIRALTRAYRSSTRATQFCAIGSVKTNVGHLSCAAGVAGLIKATLALERGLIPRSLHYMTPNREIDFAASPFYVNTILKEWSPAQTLRRAAVSSFGIGGTNAHVVLEEAPRALPSAPPRGWHLLVASARTEKALERQIANMASYLKTHPDVDLADVAFTCQVGRRHFAHRCAVVCCSIDGAVQALDGCDGTSLFVGRHEAVDRPVVFLFPGQGTQYPNMARELYDTNLTFRGHVDTCAARLAAVLGIDIREVIYPPDECGAESARIQLNQTGIAQPALFVIEYALARLWMSWGIQPSAMLGHSIGEYVAACLAGVISLDDALSVVAERGRLMQALPPGAMLAVALDAKQLAAHTAGGNVALAAVNGPSSCVLAGSLEAIADIERSLAAAGVGTSRLATSHAFHSPMMDAAVEPFVQCMQRIALAPPKTAYISNLSGTWITAAEAIDPVYWGRHLRAPVRFSEGAAEILKNSDAVLLEVGSGRVLGSLVRQHALASDRTIVASLPSGSHKDSAVRAAIEALGKMWLGGVRIDWPSVHAPARRRRLALPTYPFERQQYWITPTVDRNRAQPVADAVHSDVRAEQSRGNDESGGHLRLSRRRALTTKYIAPRDAEETEIARIWERALGLSEIGVNDNFFEVGGHSLLAISLVDQISREAAVALPLQLFFAKPTVAGIATTVAELKNAAPDREDSSGQVTIVPLRAERYLPFPLTPVQEAYWLGRSHAFELGDVGSQYYFEVEVGTLDLDRFQDAVQHLIDRHEALRLIVRPDGQQQVLERVPPYEIDVIDLTSTECDSVADALESVRAQICQQVIDPHVWPLFRVVATRRSDDGLRLHVAFDLLLADAWSHTILLRDLFRLYAAPDVELPALELSFRDYVLAVFRMRESALYQRALEYWQARLATLPAAPELPVARELGAPHRSRFMRRSGRLDPEQWARLKATAARAGVTASVAVLSAYAEVLALWSKSPKFTLNLTLFNRLPLHPQVNDIVGDFTGTILLAVDGSAGGTFAERAQLIQKQLWEALDHRYVSGVEVLRELTRVRGDASGNLMPVVFTSVLDLRTGDAPVASERTFSVCYALSQGPQIWLDNQVVEEAGALAFFWDAVEALFPEELLNDMFEAYRGLLVGLADDEEFWASRRPVVVPAYQLEQRARVNATEGPVSNDLLHTMVARQVEAQPDHIAIVSGDRRLAYHELHEMWIPLARDLRERGARPNALVAVVMDKGWEQVVAVLAILEAGAAYLPIDPSLPQERIEYLLDRGEVALALTQSWVDSRLDWPSGVERIPVDTAPTPLLRAENLPPLQTAADLAYVIFTSGSTGEPKGVMIDHRGAVNTISDINRRFAVGRADRVLALSSLSFDLSVYDIFGTLAAGGTIVMPAPEAIRDARHWTDLIARERITIWNSVPALLEMLLAAVEFERNGLAASLRLVMLSGDWIPVALPGRVRALVPDAEVVSLGGATEASIWSILYPIDRSEAASLATIPYGMPMANQSFHSLDEALEPRPIWVPGQLYIGGMGLAQGYWRDPQRTSTQFLKHPRTGERLYATGDVGRYLPDGNIEFLGREDQQVKVRGNRIEVGEIEAALATHKGVREAVVEPRGDGAQRRLVAYVVREHGDEDGRAGAESEHVRGWQHVFVDTYGGENDEETFDRRGWTNSYTGEAIATEEMREWLEQTVERVKQLKPRRVLEIGCGTGMLLHRLAPDCEAYWATDFAGNIVQSLRLAVERRGLVGVKLLEQEATDFRGMEGMKFDLVIINSVIQYLPNVEYVSRVLAGAVDRVRTGGRVFVGDLRHAGLLEALHTSVELRRGPAEMLAEVAAQRVRRQVELEQELALDPRVFRALSDSLPNITGVWVWPKRGCVRNELTKFRYDAVMEVGGKRRDDCAVEWRSGTELSLESIGATLRKRGPRVVVLQGVDNARVLEEVRTWAELKKATGDATIASVRAAVMRAANGIGIEPEALWALEKETRGYTVELSWAAGRAEGAFDVVLRRRGEGMQPVVMGEQLAGGWEAYGNEPLRAKVQERWAEELREHVRRKLPDYMVPALVMPVEALPLTANGKVDRRALPAPEARPITAGAPTPPRTALERRLVELWERLLRVDHVGIHDNFFTLGGHSLTATQLSSRILNEFGVEIVMKQFFESPTIVALAAFVVDARKTSESGRPMVLPFARGRRTLDDLIAEVDALTDDHATELSGHVSA